MAEKRPAKAAGKTAKGFTAEERAAMKERAQEVTSTGRRARSGKADGESDVLAKIAEMPEPDRTMAQRIHAIVKESAPDLTPKTWYGMPAYDERVLCFEVNPSPAYTYYQGHTNQPIARAVAHHLAGIAV